MKLAPCLLAALSGILLPSSAPALVLAQPEALERYRELGAAHSLARIGNDGGGTLIAPRWVLTAAHVARGAVPEIAEVTIGTQRYPVIEVQIAPGFVDIGGQRPLADDIALLGLGTPAAVATVPYSCATPVVGQAVLLVGGGDVRDANRQPIGSAPAGTVLGGRNVIRALDQEWIEIALADALEIDLGAVGAGGDSGGPLLAREKGHWAVVGISSHAAGQSSRSVDRYTALAHHCEWIAAHIERDPERSSAIVPAPQSAAQQIGADWIAAYNEGADAILEFYRDRLSEGMTGSTSLDQRMASYDSLRDQWGSLEVTKLRDGRQANAAEAIVRTEQAGALILVFETVIEDGVVRLDLIARAD